MIKTNIKMRVTPEQSAKVQEIFFKNGIEWWDRKKIIQHIDEPYLFVSNNKLITYVFYEDTFNEYKAEEIDPELFIRTNGSCIEKEEFIYPMWLKSKKTNIIVRFDSFNKGEVVYVSKEEFFYKTGMTLGFIPHTDTTIWEQVENPDLVTEIDNNKAKNPNSKHYELWENFEAIDIIKLALTDEEYKGFLKGNILKYQLRLGKKDDVSKEIEKIKDYERELKKNESSNSKNK